MNKCAPSLLGNTYYEGLDNCKAVGPEPTHKMSNWTHLRDEHHASAVVLLLDNCFLFIFRRGFLRFRRFHAQRGRPGTQTTPNPTSPDRYRKEAYRGSPRRALGTRWHALLFKPPYQGGSIVTGAPLGTVPYQTRLGLFVRGIQSSQRLRKMQSKTRRGRRPEEHNMVACFPP